VDAMTTYQAVKAAAVNKERLWFVVDGADHRVGRLASVIATVLMGKHKPFYHPAVQECGDNVIVLNADKVTFSGSKESQKIYRWERKRWCFGGRALTFFVFQAPHGV
jgi:large subunit ribosomal protein L13